MQVPARLQLKKETSFGDLKNYGTREKYAINFMSTQNFGISLKRQLQKNDFERKWYYFILYVIRLTIY